MTEYKTEFLMISDLHEYDVGQEGNEAAVLNRKVRKVALRRRHLTRPEAVREFVTGPPGKIPPSIRNTSAQT